MKRLASASGPTVPHQRVGLAQVKMAKGVYDLVVWKAGYDTPATSVRIEADTFLPIEVWALPEDDPDSVWTA